MAPVKLVIKTTAVAVAVNLATIAPFTVKTPFVILMRRVKLVKQPYGRRDGVVKGGGTYAKPDRFGGIGRYYTHGNQLFTGPLGQRIHEVRTALDAQLAINAVNVRLDRTRFNITVCRDL